MTKTIINENNMYLTTGARESLSDIEIALLLRRFNLKDFGKICEEDIECNNESISKNTGMVLGAYDVDDTTIWVISHLGENGYTTILLPEEY